MNDDTPPDSTPRKTAIVTGAARGIGLACARAFLDEGWQVAMVDRDAPELTRATEGLEHVLPVVADVSNPDQVARMAQGVQGWAGRIDALVNNAGVADFQRIENTDFALWRQIMDTNLDGVFLCSQEVAPIMARGGGGAIVNISSISGLRASTLRVAYGTSKAAVAHLTRQQAVELGERAIRVNAVAPGPVRTKLAAAVHSPEILKAYTDAIPLARSGTEREIADVVLFLCSDKASYVTGQVIAVDGGFDAAGVGLPALRAALNSAPE